MLKDFEFKAMDVQKYLRINPANSVIPHLLKDNNCISNLDLLM